MLQTGVASADPATTAIDPTAGLSLPTGFPAELKQYVAGTPEFKAAPWMTGACAGQGGDVGQYMNAIAPVEARLDYWLMDDAGRKAFWKNANATINNSPNPENFDPPASLLPKLFPGDDPYVKFPSAATDGSLGLCATNFAAASTPATSNVFGFQWLPAPDADSARQATDSDTKKRYAQAANACNQPTSLTCVKAYYLDCTKTAVLAQTSCFRWNNAAVSFTSSLIDWQHEQAGSVLGSIDAFLGRIAAPYITVGAAVVNGFTGVFKALAAVVDFISNPSAEIERLSNTMKTDAISMTKAVLSGYNQISAWDPAQGNFASRYAKVEALGILLLAFMFFGAIRKAMNDNDRDAIPAMLGRLVKALVMMAWAPAAFSIVANISTDAGDAIVANFTGTETGTAVAKLANLSALTAVAVPGGAITGVLCFGLIFLGMIGLFIGLMIQRFGMEMGAVLTALSAGLYVHPTWRRKTEKTYWVVAGLLAAHPLAFLVVGVAMGIVADNATLSGSPLQVLGGLSLAAIGLCAAGLAPFALLKWAPIMPTSSGSHDYSSGALAGAVIGAGSSLAMRGAYGRGGGKSSGSGGASGGAAAGGQGGGTAGGAAGQSGAGAAPAVAGRGSLLAGYDAQNRTKNPATNSGGAGVNGAAAGGGGGSVLGAGNPSGGAGGLSGASAGGGTAGKAAGAALGGGAAVIGVQAAGAVIRKASHTAKAATPEVDVPSEGSSS